MSDTKQMARQNWVNGLGGITDEIMPKQTVQQEPKYVQTVQELETDVQVP
jgi:hypothetical protein